MCVSAFKFFKQQRHKHLRGFATPCSSGETVCFAKFTLGLRETDQTLCSKRLLGSAALETRQAQQSVVIL